MPLIPMLPLIFGINHDTENKKEIDKLIITLTIVFLAITIMFITMSFY